MIRDAGERMVIRAGEVNDAIPVNSPGISGFSAGSKFKNLRNPVGFQQRSGQARNWYWTDAFLNRKGMKWTANLRGGLRW